MIELLLAVASFAQDAPSTDENDKIGAISGRIVHNLTCTTDTLTWISNIPPEGGATDATVERDPQEAFGLQVLIRNSNARPAIRGIATEIRIETDQPQRDYCAGGGNQVLMETYEQKPSDADGYYWFAAPSGNGYLHLISSSHHGGFSFYQSAVYYPGCEDTVQIARQGRCTVPTIHLPVDNSTPTE